MKNPDTESSGFNSQSQAILAFLQAGNKITGLEALRLFNCMSLAQRIFDLRRRGDKITSKMIRLENDKRIAVYSVEQDLQP